MNAENYIKNWEECALYILSKYPEEAGGVIDKRGKFHPVENIAEDKLNCFETEPMDFKNVRCVLHSHTYDPRKPLDLDPRTPSQTDMEQQVATDVEWAIVVCEGENVSDPWFWGDVKHRPDLMKREFIHSMQDCLGFMQDWMYKHHKLELPFFPRTPTWWMEKKNYIEDNYKDWGFEDVDQSLPAQRGDLVFYQIGSDVINHIGVMQDAHSVAHHLFQRMPKAEAYSVWSKYAIKRVRHKSLNKNTTDQAEA